MQDRSFSKILILIFFACLGLSAGILIVASLSGWDALYLAVAGALLLAAVLAAGVGIYRLRQKSSVHSGEGADEGSEVGFVVDTFHDLMAKLREKERELERLKSFAEEKASRIEAYNVNVLQSVPSGVISIDRVMKIRTFNEAASRILGIQEKDVVDRTFPEVFHEPLSSLVHEKLPVARKEYEYLTSDNRHIWLGITSSSLKNSTGEEIGMIFVFTDLTDIKLLQSQIEMKERLSQLGEMSAGIAHELRNAMGVISGYAKLLGKKVAPSDRQTAESIISEIGSMNRIISELLAFARPDVLHTSDLDLTALVRETAASAAGGSDSISVTINIPGPLTIVADEVLMRQALKNIFVNAVEAMPEGGTLTIDSETADKRLTLRITDSGCGIADDIRKKIFLPFFTTKQNGIGFGLALVQKIIVSHGGGIEVEGREGEGTTFVITLPCQS